MPCWIWSHGKSNTSPKRLFKALLLCISNRLQNEEIFRGTKPSWTMEACFFLKKNKAGDEYVNPINILLKCLLETTSPSCVRMSTTKLLPHLVLTKTHNSFDSSKAKTQSWRINRWKRADIENIFNEANASQFTLPKTWSKTDDIKAKQFNRKKWAGIIFSAIGWLANRVFEVFFYWRTKNTEKNEE